jgi:hypothetical protein
MILKSLQSIEHGWNSMHSDQRQHQISNSLFLVWLWNVCALSVTLHTGGIWRSLCLFFITVSVRGARTYDLQPLYVIVYPRPWDLLLRFKISHLWIMDWSIIIIHGMIILNHPILRDSNAKYIWYQMDHPLQNVLRPRSGVSHGSMDPESNLDDANDYF